MNPPIRIACVLLLATGGAAVSAMADEIIIRVPVPAVAVSRDTDGFARFSGPALQILGATGEPALPHALVKALLPPDADPARVSVRLASETLEEVPGEWEVRPVPPLAGPRGPVWPGGRRFDERGRDLDVYGSADRFPARLLADTRGGQTREWRLLDAGVVLYQYEPANRKLHRLASAEIVVTYATTPRAMAARVAAEPSELAEDTVRRLTVNFDQVAPLYDLAARPTRTPSTSLAPEVAEAARYVVLTTRAVADGSRELARFVASKERRGLTVRVVTEETWGGGTGDAAAENIRRWLQQSYAALGIEYVLLVGNPDPQAGDVPMKQMWPRNPDRYLDSPSDYYYADLTGNWDLDGDGLYGEAPRDEDPPDDHGDFGPGGIDLNWDVIVGRVPYYGSLEDLDLILAKIVAYENASPASTGWRKRMLLPMKPSDASTPGYQLGEEIKDAVLVPKGWGYTRVYDEPYGLVPPPESTPCTMDNVTAAWSSSPPGVAVWWTHGSSQTASEVMNLPHLPLLPDRTPAFTFQASCSNSYPEDTSNLAYSLLRQGGIGTVAATRWSWYWVGQGTPMFPIPFAGTPTNSGMAFEYARLLVANELEAGRALYEMKQLLGPGIWMNFTVFNLYGDPSLSFLSTGEGAPPPEGDETVCAAERVELDRIASSAGLVASNGTFLIEEGRSGTLHGDVYSVGWIRSRGRMTIEGDVVTGESLEDEGRLKVRGTVQERASVVPCVVPRLEAALTRGTAGLRVAEHRSARLRPGAYGTVEVRDGATLRLAAGEYFVWRLDVHSSASLLADVSAGPVVVHVKDRLEVGRRARVDVEHGGSTRDLVLDVRQRRSLEVGADAVVGASLIAPDAAVELGPGSRLEGSCRARKVEVERGARFRPHPKAN